MQNKSKEFQVIIDKDIDSETKEILNRYWKFDGSEFQEQIGKIGKEFCLDYTPLIKIIQKHSSGYVTDYCYQCAKQLFYKVKSQTKFLLHFRSSNFCDACQNIINENNKRRSAELRKRHIATRKQKLNRAIQIRAWEKLSIEECHVLLGLVKNPDRTIDFGKLNHLNRTEKQKILDKYDSLGLIVKGMDYGYYKLELDFSKYLPRKLRCYLLEFKKKDFQENYKNEEMEIPF
ncbi:MAG: hypothetical protein ABJN95_17005 [Maribacter sp.]|uniref:hypothetical protein n=1 Tax=Maribacter sp. TaxID=1897614 RepID=UPI00329A1450